MEEGEKNEILEETLRYLSEKDRNQASSKDGWSEFVFKVVFPIVSAIFASIAKVFCEHFLGG